MPDTLNRDRGLWIFGYGSLMWDPGFPIVHTCCAVLNGYHRRFSVYSNGSYGCPESPGLALGLHPGGSCRARAFHVAPTHSEETLAYLDRREAAYLRKTVTIALEDGDAVWAVTYVINPEHPRYARDLPVHETAQLILTGSGSKGTSLGYLEKTVSELESQGMRQSNMHDLLNAVRSLARSKEPRER